MKLLEGIHLIKLPNGKAELCTGLETMLRFPDLTDSEFRLLNHLVAGCTRSEFCSYARSLKIPTNRVSSLLTILVNLEVLQLRRPRTFGGIDDDFWVRVGGKKMRHTYRERKNLSVSINRSDRMAQLLSLELGAAGIGKIKVPPGIRSTEPDLDAGMNRARNIKELLGQHRLDTTVTSDKGSVDLAIILGWGLPNPLLTHQAMQHNQAFLSVVAGHDWVEVGPLVLPGLTPCAACVTMYRSADIPDLGQRAVNLQWVEYPRVETSLAGLGAALATAQALAFLDRRDINPGLVTRLHLDGNISTECFEANPHCDCSYLPLDIENPPEPAFSRVPVQV